MDLKLHYFYSLGLTIQVNAVLIYIIQLMIQIHIVSFIIGKVLFLDQIKHILLELGLLYNNIGPEEAFHIWMLPFVLIENLGKLCHTLKPIQVTWWEISIKPFLF